jgi:hypothetical protein
MRMAPEYDIVIGNLDTGIDYRAGKVQAKTRAAALAKAIKKKGWVLGYGRKTIHLQETKREGKGSS